MFEHDQEIVNALLSESNDFKRLYDKHSVLKSAVSEANNGKVNIDDQSLEELKKEKLDLKDRMASIIQNYKHNHA